MYFANPRANLLEIGQIGMSFMRRADTCLLKHSYTQLVLFAGKNGML